MEAGATSLFVVADDDSMYEFNGYVPRLGMSAHDDIKQQTRDFFQSARRVAKDAAESRNQYMEARFARGEHPDTHPEFWDGYTQMSLPALPNGFLGLGFSSGNVELIVVLSGMLLAGGLVGLYLLGLWRRKRRARKATIAV